MRDFTDDLCAAALSTEAGDHRDRAMLGRAIADTLAVAVAGFGTPSARAAVEAVAQPHGAATAWSGRRVASVEDAALANAAAAHALDFDDLDTLSSAHLNAVVLPALCCGPAWPAEHDLLAAMQSGMLVAQVIAARLGGRHHSAGWHPTATIGVLAATAARARIRRLSPETLGHALALAAVQAGGLRSNFGTLAKALHAGFAAAAAVRSVTLAERGVTGGRVLASGGFFDLYGAGPRSGRDAPLVATIDGLAPKLYPCCFAAHRMVEAALQARRTLGPSILSHGCRVIVRAPASSLAVLRVDRPATAVEACFSARYCVAVALRDGVPMLRHFTDPLDPDLLSALDRIHVVALPDGADGSGLRGGSATLMIERDGGTHTFHQSDLPGSDDHDAPLRAKIADCLSPASVEGIAAAATLLPWMRTLPAVAPWLPPDQTGR